MRAIWTGALSFGLVNIPVRLYSAIGEGRPSFRFLHQKDNSPIKYVRICTADGKEVPFDDIVRGFEVTKGQFVVLTEDDFKNVNVKKTKTIDVFKFTDEKDIDLIYAARPYFLEPDKGAAKPYALLLAALKKSKQVGLAKFVLRNREHVAVVRPLGGVVSLQQLRYEKEIRKPTGLNLPDPAKVEKKELDMAIQLVDQLQGAFQPARYKDTYSEELEQLIAKKAKGKKVTAKGKAPEATQVKDLMSALKKSLESEQVK
jgi:DNA end-binding protein Ku